MMEDGILRKIKYKGYPDIDGRRLLKLFLTAMDDMRLPSHTEEYNDGRRDLEEHQIKRLSGYQWSEVTKTFPDGHGNHELAKSY